MTVVGKIFTVLIFFFSVAFMMLAAMLLATHTNWKDRVELTRENALKAGKPPGMVVQLNEKNDEIKRLQGERESLQSKLEAEKVAKRLALSKSEAHRIQLEAELAKAKEELIALQKANGEASTAMKSTQENLTSLGAELDKLRKEIAESQADRDTVFNQYVAKTDEINQLMLRAKGLNDANERLVSQVARMKQLFSAIGVDENMPIDGAAPRVEGIVTGVRKNSPQEVLVGLSIGADDGLRVGHQLNVYRGAEFVGRVEVTRTMPSRSVAISLPEYYKRPFEKSDSARTITLEIPLAGATNR
jgi:hypothetical protein